MVKHLNIKVSGSVQGVFFRVFCKEKADEFGIYGFVRNDPDGSVYAEIEGEEDTLEKFLDLCRKGPEYGEVEKIDVSDGALKNFSEFVIY